jgi:hypothetical protein
MKRAQVSRGWFSSGKAIFIVSLAIALLISPFFFTVFLYKVFGLTSDNAAVYVVKGLDNNLMVKDDLPFDKAGSLVFMLDITDPFEFLQKKISSIAGVPLIELTWSEKYGDGVIKEFRPDGTRFILVLSRFIEPDSLSRGLFIGGDLPLGDYDNLHDKSRNNTGMAYFDGKKWQHIWCSINEGIRINGISLPVVEPPRWKYLGSRVLKSSYSEVMLESSHVFKALRDDSTPVELLMKRTIYKRVGDDYILLKIKYTNAARTPVTFLQAFGDEPWVGDFARGSQGNVGWTRDSLYGRADYVDPHKYKFAGQWDYGNEDAGERPGTYSGFADFVEWVSNTPDAVYFSNHFDLPNKQHVPLDSRDDRTINLLWYRTLKPGQSETIVLALGMAVPHRTVLPVKPLVKLPPGF